MSIDMSGTKKIFPPRPAVESNKVFLTLFPASLPFPPPPPPGGFFPPRRGY